MMTATEHIKEMLEMSNVSKIGASGWMHTPECDRKSADDFAKRIIELTDRSHWDFIKIMQNGVYNQEAYGSDITYLSENIPIENLHTKKIMHFNNYLLNSPEDFMRFPVLDVSQNAVYQREVAVVRALRKHYQGSVPIIPTIFLPAHTVPEFCGGIEKARYYLDNYPNAVETMLKAFVQTEMQLVDAYLDAGADGFFFANRYSNADILSESEFERFCRPFDMCLMEHVKGRAWFNIIHIHGEKNFFFRQFNEYPVQAFSWENVPHNVPEEDKATVAKVRAMTDKVLVTGTDQFFDFYGNIDEVHERFAKRLERAVKESGDNRLIFAPGCSLPLDIDFEAVHQLRVVVDEWNEKQGGNSRNL